MSISTDAILVYGIPLDEDQACSLKEYDDELENYEDTPAYLACNFGVENSDGIVFTHYCSYEYPMYIVSAGSLNYCASRGDLTEIPKTLQVPENTDEKIMAYISKYNLSIEEEKPSWFLCSLMG